MMTNAAEFIEAYRRLPQTEQEKVVQFIQHGDAVHANGNDNRVMAAAEEVFREHSELFRRLAQ